MSVPITGTNALTAGHVTMSDDKDIVSSFERDFRLKGIHIYTMTGILGCLLLISMNQEKRKSISSN